MCCGSNIPCCSPSQALCKQPTSAPAPAPAATNNQRRHMQASTWVGSHAKNTSHASLFRHHQLRSPSTKPKVSRINMPVWRRRNNNDQVANYTTSARRSSSSSSQSNYNKRSSSPHHPRLTWVWQPTVPSWEKKFCSQVGSVPWKKLLETKKMMAYYYENIVKWDDSAGEEAFNTAKARFWADMNGLPSDHIPLPDPDMYIDEIDWNTEIDPELQSDVDKQQLPSDDENEEDNDGSGNVWFQGDALYFMNQPVVCSGWGDTEDIHGGGSKQEAENYNYYYY